MEAVVVGILISFVVHFGDILKMIKTNRGKKRFRSKNGDQLFDQNFIEARVLYVKLFKAVPCVAYIGNVDTRNIFTLVEGGKYGRVRKVYQRIYHDWEDDKIYFSKTLFVLENKLMVKLAGDWLEIYYHTAAQTTVNEMLEEFKAHKAPEKEKDYEINIISMSGNSLDLKTLAIQPTTLDVDLYYNDDFKAVHETILERLGKENDKGIVLLHGLPGTGKTTYLRYLIGSLKKKVMFVSPGVAANLMNPEFMDLLLDNPNAILVIEDAENIIMERKYSSHSSVSNLLNISDGLLSDCLNVQIICTFNSEIGLVDDALLRKGRLIARYEFGKLSVKKGRKLRDHLGLATDIDRPMTLAEITNPNDVNPEPAKTNVIGFRRDFVEN